MLCLCYIIKVCTDPNITLPVYHAADLSRLPPVDASHCNVAAILAELQQLRAEVRSFQQVSDQLAVLLQEVLESREKQEVSVPCNATEFPPLPASTSGGLSSASAATASGPSVQSRHPPFCLGALF